MSNYQEKASSTPARRVGGDAPDERGTREYQAAAKRGCARLAGAEGLGYHGAGGPGLSVLSRHVSGYTIGCRLSTLVESDFCPLPSKVAYSMRIRFPARPTRHGGRHGRTAPFEQVARPSSRSTRLVDTATYSADDGETLWVHRGSITGQGLQLVPGEPVVFDRQVGGMGVQAIDVAPAEAMAQARSRPAPRGAGRADREQGAAGLLGRVADRYGGEAHRTEP